MDPFAALRLATAGFDDRLVTVRPDQWALPTPCEAWTVRDLVDHVTGGNRFAVVLITGASLGDAFEAAVAPGFGDDVVGESRASAAAQTEAFAADGALEQICHHPSGDITGATFIELRIGDLLVHTWDLARALGGDERLDDRLVARVWAHYRERAHKLAASGMFGSGSSGTAGEDAPLQDRLLDLLGRRP